MRIISFVTRHNFFSKYSCGGSGLETSENSSDCSDFILTIQKFFECHCSTFVKDKTAISSLEDAYEDTQGIVFLMPVRP